MAKTGISVRSMEIQNGRTGRLEYIVAGSNLKNMPKTKMDSVLFNVVDAAKTKSKINKTIECIQIAKPENVVMDSGGYQIFKAEKQNKKITHDPNEPLICKKDHINLSPEHLVAAAVKINPSAMIMLDFPLTMLKKGNDW